MQKTLGTALDFVVDLGALVPIILGWSGSLTVLWFLGWLTLSAYRMSACGISIQRDPLRARRFLLGHTLAFAACCFVAACYILVFVYVNPAQPLEGHAVGICAAVVLYCALQVGLLIAKARKLRDRIASKRADGLDSNGDPNHCGRRV